MNPTHPTDGTPIPENAPVKTEASKSSNMKVIFSPIISTEQLSERQKELNEKLLQSGEPSKIVLDDVSSLNVPNEFPNGEIPPHPPAPRQED